MARPKLTSTLTMRFTEAQFALLEQIQEKFKFKHRSKAIALIMDRCAKDVLGLTEYSPGEYITQDEVEKRSKAFDLEMLRKYGPKAE